MSLNPNFYVSKRETGETNKGVHKMRLIISTRNPRLDTEGNRSTKQNEES